jgi:uncharacterized membrane protein YdjX (TVP38/TMEM64 family)
MNPPKGLEEKTKNTLLRVIALVSVIGVSLLLVRFRDQVQHLAAYGYPGIFLTALLSSATVLIPAPGLAIIFTMGAVFHPLGVALAGGAGAGLGELSGYLAGFSGQAIIERMDIYNRIAPRIQQYGAWGIFVLACIPNPTFDLAGIAAGALKIPVGQFILACVAGNTIKMLIFAYAGSLSLNWLVGK